MDVKWMLKLGYFISALNRRNETDNLPNFRHKKFARVRGNI